MLFEITDQYTYMKKRERKLKPQVVKNLKGQRKVIPPM